MKTICLLLSILGIFQVTTVQAQSLGFIEPECGIVSNPFYYYENYQPSSHGFGYVVYHNGVIIKEDGSAYGGPSVIDLKFINDTIGFLVIYTTGGLISVYKIISDSVNYIGYGAGSYYGLFIINAYTAYLVTNIGFISYQDIWITKCSDIQSSQRLIEDTSLTSNITVNDSIMGIPLCNNLKGIHYRFKNGNDTLVYTILLQIKDSLYFINEINLYGMKVFPNPAKDYIHIKTLNPESQIILNIFNSSGILQKSIISASKEEFQIYIGDLNTGEYFIELNQKTKKKIINMLKY